MPLLSFTWQFDDLLTAGVLRILEPGPLDKVEKSSLRLLDLICCALFTCVWLWPFISELSICVFSITGASKIQSLNKISVCVFFHNQFSLTSKHAAVTHCTPKDMFHIFWQINQMSFSTQHTECLLEKTNTSACHTVTMICKHGFVCVVCFQWSLFQCLDPYQWVFLHVDTDVLLWAEGRVCFGAPLNANRVWFSSVSLCTRFQILSCDR